MTSRILWLGLMVACAASCADDGPACEALECEEQGTETSAEAEGTGEETSANDGGGDDVDSSPTDTDADDSDAADPGDLADEPGGDPAEDPGEDPGTDASWTVSITQPQTQSSTESGQSVMFEGAVTMSPPDGPGALTARWISDADGVLHEGEVGDDGVSSFASANLSAGYHQITFRVEDDQGEGVSETITIGVCGWTEAENFDAPLDTSEWIGVPGSAYVTDAYRDERGWLEMTGNLQAKKGAIFNVGQAITPGNVVLRFKVSTGQCYAPDTSCTSSSPGADGFAMSVFQIGSQDQLVELLESAYSGGGLGYGVAGGYGDYEVPAFHIEFDTWHNVYNGNSEHHTDPVSEDHIAVTLNGDPGVHYLPTAVSDLEDNMWHQMEVRVVGEDVTVSMDDVELMSGTVPGLTFKGGYIGFTGSTGYYTNYHRFDDLEVEEACRF